MCKLWYDLFRRRKMSYFTDDELRCPCCGKLIVSAFLKHQLNRLRGSFGKAIYVNSCYRCKKHNRNVGGSPESSHLNGTAVDIKCNNSKDRFKLIQLALLAGFKRIGVSKDFIHLDVDEEKPQYVMWIY